ncbi:hypothetical protein HNR01_003311 [Methylorubrum rhodesianum]|uniref:BLUF domain-containing protein n=2 Tax=Methylorubrum TaxID=2282523 RepID=A0ABU9Z7D6_9HYPH|nr:hypothetical protein [Methylorubrum rhodesianum]
MRGRNRRARVKLLELLGWLRAVSADLAHLAGPRGSFCRVQACLRPVIATAARVDAELSRRTASMKNKRTSLVHLIYFSRLTISNEPALRAKQIGDITRQAQKKNEFAVITSFLIIDQNFAIQVVEGERQSVNETFQRIAADSRHRDVQIVEWREIAKREFVSSFTTVSRTAANEPHFAKSGLLPMLQRGTPKGSAIHGLAVTLQAESMAKQGIDHLFV